ncbi:nucleotidyltransferase domain-containing protein [Bacillus sp. V2I10]|uniref:nucleotidyltransferase domain-containing protein n=1 Tax=Bacillus sp. V2I10 TaxID=3042276 RepID=UPI0027D84F9D|nr:nucleotidyltransferase domain-containing protein [Bacillus sp. V2I10]
MKSLLNGLIKLFKKMCKKTLSGIYLHGSLAMNGFNKEASDVDILTVVKSSIENRGETDAIKSAQVIEIRVAG